jgi:hypothetical protein
MGISYRMFLLDRNGRIYRLSVVKFDRMLRDPRGHRYPLFAGQRIRAAGSVVQVAGRRPTKILQMIFPMLTFDSAGRFDVQRFSRQQFSRFEVSMAPLQAGLSMINDGANTAVVDASSRFIAQGSSWAPSKTLARAIRHTALGRQKCPRL